MKEIVKILSKVSPVFLVLVLFGKIHACHPKSPLVSYFNIGSYTFHGHVTEADCTVDTNICNFDGSGSWKVALTGIGYLNGVVNLRCDLPGFCRYRYKILIPTDYECMPSYHNGPACVITGGGCQSYAMYGEILVPGDSVYTRIIPVFKGDLSTNHIPVKILDRGLDPSANNYCSLTATSTNGNTQVPGDAQICHYSNKEEGPYTIKCGDGKIGRCDLKRSISIGSAHYQDKKTFYIYGIDKILVKQDISKPGDEIIRVSSLDTISKDLPDLGGFHLFVKYNGDYFDLLQTTNLIKGGGKKVNKVYEITQEYKNPKENGLPIYASGYSSLQFCKERGFDYVKSFSISSSKVTGEKIRYTGSTWWRVYDNYYVFNKIVCGKQKVDYDTIDTYPGTNNMIGYGVHHLQWFYSLGPKIVEIEGNKTKLDLLKKYLRMDDVKYFKLIKEDKNKLIYEFEEANPNSPKYTFVFIEPPVAIFGNFTVTIYPKNIPAFKDKFILQWLVGVEKKLGNKKLLISTYKDDYWMVPLNNDKYQTAFGEVSNAHPLHVKEVNDVVNARLKSGELLKVNSPTDPYFPNSLIPGDKLDISFAYDKLFGTSNKIKVNVKLQTQEGDIILNKDYFFFLNKGHNEFHITEILPSRTKSGKVYYGKSLKLIVSGEVPYNLEKLMPLENNLMKTDPIKIHFGTIDVGKKIVINPDPQKTLFETGDSFSYTFNIVKENQRLINRVRVNFLVQTIDGKIVNSWSKSYNIKEGDNIFTEVYKIPEKDLDGETIKGKDLSLTLSFNILYDQYSDTSVSYYWIRLKSPFKTFKLGREVFLNQEEFKTWLNNKFKYNTIDKSLYMATYNDFKMRKYKEEKDVKKITLYLHIVRSNEFIYNKIKEIVKGEPGVRMEGDTLIFDWYVKGKDTTNAKVILDKIRRLLTAYKIYWEEWFKVQREDSEEKVIDDIV